MDLYKILGISRKSTKEQIKKAYLKKSIEHHPDKGGDPEIFKNINLAHRILSDPKKHKDYDKYGRIDDATHEVILKRIFDKLFNIKDDDYLLSTMARLEKGIENLETEIKRFKDKVKNLEDDISNLNSRDCDNVVSGLFMISNILKSHISNDEQTLSLGRVLLKEFNRAKKILGREPKRQEMQVVFNSSTGTAWS